MSGTLARYGSVTVDEPDYDEGSGHGDMVDTAISLFNTGKRIYEGAQQVHKRLQSIRGVVSKAYEQIPSYGPPPPFTGFRPKSNYVRGLVHPPSSTYKKKRRGPKARKYRRRTYRRRPRTYRRK